MSGWLETSLVDTKQVDNLFKLMSLVPNVAENKINEYLWNKAAPETLKASTNEIPLSIKNKKHARYSNPLEIINTNLGFAIKSKKQYHYLVFPYLAVGNSYKNEPDKFLDRGVNTDKITKDLSELLQKEIQKNI